MKQHESHTKFLEWNWAQTNDAVQESESKCETEKEKKLQHGIWLQRPAAVSQCKRQAYTIPERELMCSFYRGDGKIR